MTALFGIFVAEPAFAAGPLSGAPLVIGFPYSVGEINPFITSSSSSANLVELVYDPLVNLDEAFELKPHLAQSWTVSADGLVWTFRLAPGVKFHDGTPLTAADVAFTFEVHLNAMKTSPAARISANISSVAARGEDEVIFILKRPDRIFNTFLRSIFIVPKKNFTLSGQPQDPAATPVGSGAYRVAAQSPDKVLFTANADYFLGAPALDGITVRSYANVQILLAQLIAGEVDLEIFSDFHYQDTVRNVPYLKSLPYENQLLFAVFFNLRRPKFASPAVRQALNLAVDKNSLMARLQGDGGSVAAGLLSPRHPFYNSQIQPYEYEPKLAQNMLIENGYVLNPKTGFLERGGKPFSFTILCAAKSPLVEKALLHVAADLEKIGVKTVIEALTMSELLQRVFAAKDFEAALFPYSNTNGLEIDAYLWSGDDESANFTGYHDAKAGEFLAAARYTLSAAESLANYHEYQKILSDNPPAIYLFWQDLGLVVNERVTNLSPKPFNLFLEMKNVELVR